ncbi:MAG: HAMP domain-containing sensor histidine kinase [Propionicimonas sp.]
MTGRRVSSAVTAAGFVLASLGLIVVLYSSVQPFSYYGRRFPIALPGAPVAGLIALVSGFVIATWSCLADAERRSRARLHRLDWFFVLIGLVAVWSLLAGFFEAGRGFLGWHLICLTILAVTGGYAWATTLVRLRAGTLRETVFWFRVFAVLPVRQFSGVFIMVVVVIASGVLLLGALTSFDSATRGSSYSDIVLSLWLADWLTTVALPGLTLAVVAVLCANILSITAARQAAVEAQLREERFRAELVTNVTHDIRTPLTSIINYVDLIDKLELDDPTLAEYTSVLGRKAERLRVLIGDLLEASRASAGTLVVRLQPIDLTELLAQVAGDLDEALAARQITWIGPPPGPVWVQADGEQLWRILENLVGNVTKYAKPGSCAHAELFRTPTTVVLRLANLTAEPLLVPGEELIAQFARGDASRHAEGSGLGLFIADRLAQLMGASLRVSVDGTHFAAVVELPAAVPAADGWSVGGQPPAAEELTGARQQLR